MPDSSRKPALIADDPARLLRLLETNSFAVQAARKSGDTELVERSERLVFWCMKSLASLRLEDALPHDDAARAEQLFLQSGMEIGREIDEPESMLELLARRLEPVPPPKPQHPFPGDSGPRHGSRKTHCWRCRESYLDSAVHAGCPRCQGICCPRCGACLCGFS